MKYYLQWTVGHSASPELLPEKMAPASVPGNANMDWAAANDMPDWKFGVNFEQFRWMEDCWWLYETQMPNIALKPDETLFFVTKGIDYQYRILLNGQTICEHEGMFSTVEIPLVGANEGLLHIWIAPAPKDTMAHKDTREEAAQCCKPAVSYGWDWHPRLIPVGIWEETYLEVRSADYLLEAGVDYRLAEDYSSAQVFFKSKTIGNGDVKFTLFDPKGQLVMESFGNEDATLKSPLLWWCNGYGKPNLYRWDAVLTAGDGETDKRSGVIGFRTLELTMNEGSWDEPEDFPKGRSPAPITITLNGVHIFAKGSNWVNPEVFTGAIKRETYLPLVKLAQEANFNIFRCWGGAIVNKEMFFDLCDECGILVWQEFMLSCNNYRGTPHYLRILRQEACFIIKRLKHHPSLAIWCGGNELFNSWSKMTDQSAALRLLNKLCYELDPERPFLMTSPLFGMAHGNYLFRYPDGREVFQIMPDAHNTAYTEFGVPSISNLACCKMAAEEADIFPLEETAVTVAHHAFHAWYSKYPWACTDIIRDYFGEAQTLEQLINWSQWLQGEGYKCIYEEARRQKPYCSMAINWCYNEPWPTIANNSIINYPAEPKESYREVADACRSALISARIPKFAWRGGETFSADLWLLNDGREPVAAGQAKVLLELRGVKYPLQGWQYGEVGANANLEGPTVRIKLPCFYTEQGNRVKTLNQGAMLKTKGNLHEMKLLIQAGKLSSQYRLLYNE